MKTLRKETRSCSRSNSGIKSNHKCERSNEIRPYASIGYFESMSLLK
jgi:hypothetical protein